MSVAEVTATARYPIDPEEVGCLHDTSAKFVPYLFNKYRAELFPKIVDRVFGGEPAASVLVEIYGN